MSIKNAHIEFNDNGTPIATHFDDVYFSDAKGFEETEYVFMQHNGLPEAWQNWQTKYYTIAETGFGTGLNFLVTLLHFDEFLQQHPDSQLNLYFTSIEKFPIHVDALTKALAVYPKLKPYAEQLIHQYPEPIQGCHRLHFLNHKVCLDLWLGDVHEILPQIDTLAHGLIDAWYLDGFAPSKNPEMWSQNLFEQMARLAKHNCRFATFTAAGDVRRGLIQAGFEVKKCKGFGRKRDMIAGHIEKPCSNSSRLPYFIRSKASFTSTKPSVAIIGGGLAGANCAYALAKKGFSTTIYCQDNALSQGASGNPQGGFYPQLNAEAGISSQIHASAFCYASRVYQQLLSAGFNYTHDWCGTLLMSFNDKVEVRYQKMVENQTWPKSFIYPVDQQQASKLAGLPIPYSGLFVPKAGWINPPELTQALVSASNCQVQMNCKLQSAKRHNNQWQLNWQNGIQTQADIVIFATGSDSAEIAQLQELPFRLVRGQVEAIPTDPNIKNLTTVLCHKGYFTPQFNGRHALGSTYIKNDKSCDYRDEEQATNLQIHQKSIAQCDWVHRVNTDNTGRASIRCSTPDHLPVVGAVPDYAKQKEQYADLYKALPARHYPQPEDYPNLFVLSGLGSRGLSTAPLCAEILASQIVGTPLPLSNQLLDALNPNRFLIRGLIRREI